MYEAFHQQSAFGRVCSINIWAIPSDKGGVGISECWWYGQKQLKFASVFIFYFCCNKLPQISWLKKPTDLLFYSTIVHQSSIGLTRPNQTVAGQGPSRRQSISLSLAVLRDCLNSLAPGTLPPSSKPVAQHFSDPASVVTSLSWTLSSAAFSLLKTLWLHWAHLDSPG